MLARRDRQADRQMAQRWVSPPGQGGERRSQASLLYADGLLVRRPQRLAAKGRNCSPFGWLSRDGLGLSLPSAARCGATPAGRQLPADCSSPLWTGSPSFRGCCQLCPVWGQKKRDKALILLLRPTTSPAALLCWAMGGTGTRPRIVPWAAACPQLWAELAGSVL